jgi:peptidoglycan/xylan/chitin deacetylase (PgdA/CDA1 family)
VLPRHLRPGRRPGRQGLRRAPARFRRQLDSLRRAGYRFIHPDELLAFLDGRAGLPRRPLLLTFDDCYADLLDTALPELVERGIPAVAFAVSGCIGASNRWDQAAGAATLPLLDVPGLEALARSGLEIGGHSRTHRSLVEVDAAELAGETAAVAADLERAGLAAPRLFAYPYGDHTSAVRQAGYAAAFGVSPAASSRPATATPSPASTSAATTAACGSACGWPCSAAAACADPPGCCSAGSAARARPWPRWRPRWPRWPTPRVGCWAWPRDRRG